MLYATITSCPPSTIYLRTAEPSSREVEPMREHGGSAPADELFTVKDSLFRLAEDIGLSYSTVETRSPAGLIVLKARAITLPLPRPESQP
ncbi:hypothetical protein [Streptomyces variegatus]|uniref:hypothetical protein n=1 Tax=Streptomyces variegatus TaxID=284040 RepID=UPI003C2F7260